MYCKTKTHGEWIVDYKLAKTFVRLKARSEQRTFNFCNDHCGWMSWVQITLLKGVQFMYSGREVNTELSQVWCTSCMAELIFDLIDRQFLCKKYQKPVTIKYLRTGITPPVAGIDKWVLSTALTILARKYNHCSSHFHT